MLKKKFKKYGTVILAAVFLTVAGLCYGFGRSGDSPLSAGESSKTEEVGKTLLAATDGDTGTEEASLPPETENVSVCYVHVCGEVMKPGVYELTEESRIFEAVEAAGGFTENAADDSLNLAGKVTDGMQLVVLSREEAELAAAEKAAESSGIVNLNTATKEQLMTLKGVGESRAEDIIRYREESGGFQKIEDIMKVPGIKDAGFQKIKDSITV